MNLWNLNKIDKVFKCVYQKKEKTRPKLIKLKMETGGTINFIEFQGINKTYFENILENGGKVGMRKSSV